MSARSPTIVAFQHLAGEILDHRIGEELAAHFVQALPRPPGVRLVEREIEHLADPRSRTSGNRALQRRGRAPGIQDPRGGAVPTIRAFTSSASSSAEPDAPEDGVDVAQVPAGIEAGLQRLGTQALRHPGSASRHSRNARRSSHARIAFRWTTP